MMGMTGMMDEMDIKKRLLEELQNQMSGRRVSPILSIDISAGEPDEDDAEEADEMGGESELGEPTDVKGRLGSLLRKRGMMG